MMPVLFQCLFKRQAHHLDNLIELPASRLAG